MCVLCVCLVSSVTVLDRAKNQNAVAEHRANMAEHRANMAEHMEAQKLTVRTWQWTWRHRKRQKITDQDRTSNAEHCSAQRETEHDRERVFPITENALQYT